ncbi:MAG: hypothetical protein U1F34_05440 [Gammaproteobacteria bacterium]
MRPPGGMIALAPVAEWRSARLAHARAVLVQRGYQEAVTYSFVDAELDAKVGVSAHAIALANPISADMAVMRTSIWTGLIKALSTTSSRQQPHVRLFEIGRGVSRSGQTIQINKLAYIVIGNSEPEQ